MLLNALLLALRAIRRNLMRSFLTVLGVVIGVAAVVTMVTLGNGATKMVSDQISSLGSNLLILSPGQRLGPGRDSAGANRFKLADEPTGNRDSQRSHEIMELLVALNREQGITVVMVTHEPDMAAYASRIVHFVDGRVDRDSRQTSCS